MPKIPRVDVFDDLEYEGGEGREVVATEQREFSVAGKDYRTYLSAENAKRFDDDMVTWTKFAEPVEPSGPGPVRRRTTTTTTSASSSAPRRDRQQTAEIRDWARGQRFDPPVSDRGRIPDYITEAYYEAYPEKRPGT